MATKFNIKKFNFIFNKALSEFCTWVMMLDQTDKDKMFGFTFLVAQAIITKSINDFWDMFSIKRKDEINKCSDLSISTLYWELRYGLDQTKRNKDKEWYKVSKICYKMSSLSRTINNDRSVTWFFKHEVNEEYQHSIGSKSLNWIAINCTKLAFEINRLFKTDLKKYGESLVEGIVYTLGSMCYYNNNNFFDGILDNKTSYKLFGKFLNNQEWKIMKEKQNDIEEFLLKSFNNPFFKKTIVDILSICRTKK